MKLKSIELNAENYQKYLSGLEVDCHAKEKITIGEEIIVLKDSTANHTVAGVPTRERQADYIGVNGIVITILDETESDRHIMIRKK